MTTVIRKSTTGTLRSDEYAHPQFNAPSAADPVVSGGQTRDDRQVDDWRWMQRPTCREGLSRSRSGSPIARVGITIIATFASVTSAFRSHPMTRKPWIVATSPRTTTTGFARSASRTSASSSAGQACRRRIDRSSSHRPRSSAPSAACRSGCSTGNRSVNAGTLSRMGMACGTAGGDLRDAVHRRRAVPRSVGYGRVAATACIVSDMVNRP